MGPHDWTVYNDFYCSGEKDGLCVDISDRCNSDPGCFDLSDEFDCKIINPGKSYQSFIAPPPISDTGEKKVQIDISADIISILDIDEISSIFQVQFFLYFSWHDPRLIFYNLKSDIGLNALSPEEKQQIWVPKLLFSNTENKLDTLVDKDAIVTIERRGNFTIPDKSDVENRQFYHGKDDHITLSRFYNIRFLCQYSMNWYPFDLQKCSLILQMKGKGKDFADLNTDHLMYLGSDEVNQYVVYSYKMQLLPEDPSQVEIVVNLGRNLLTIILTTFVPTVLLNMISYSTTFFKAFFFEATVTVNLTAMLVLTTLFINVSNSLPPTSYIKMIDIYLIYSLMIPFVEVLLQTYMETLRLEAEFERKNEKESKLRTINHHGRVRTVSENGFGKKSWMPGTVNNGYDDNIPTIPEAQDINKMDLFNEIKSFSDSFRLKMCVSFAKTGLPIITICFQICYWSIGLIHIYSSYSE